MLLRSVMAQIEDIKNMLKFLEANHDLKHIGKNKKNWLEKTVGINGANQRIGAINMLRYLLKAWESEGEQQ